MDNSSSANIIYRKPSVKRAASVNQQLIGGCRVNIFGWMSEIRS